MKLVKSRIIFIVFLIGLTIIYVGGCRRIGTWLVKDDANLHADAMVLLMGSITDRVLQAADVYNAGLADKLIIVEESRGPHKILLQRGATLVSNTDQTRNAAVALGIPADRITLLPGDARSTLTEAMIIRDYLAMDFSIDTLLLVTSAPHSRRASMIFRAALKDTEQTCRPVVQSKHLHILQCRAMV